MILNQNNKRKYETSYINGKVANNANFVAECEAEYSVRLESVAKAIIERGCTVVMASGPSASGKTTSAWRLAHELRELGRDALVISLDDFFRNIEEYPKNEEGEPDLESVYALDLPCVNSTVSELLENGACALPQFDFKKQSRKPQCKPIRLGNGGIAIIEGIHALNPLLTESILGDGVFNIYVGLRAEYYEDGKRTLATRDLRITRRLVRDFYFRGYSIEETLSVWRHLMDGEEKWIKPFKDRADVLLDSSFAYEPCAFAPIMASLRIDEAQGGEYRPTLLSLCERFEHFNCVPIETIPDNAVLREFLGGLKMDD
ncbi:MAG: nucleoside kinase [Oscillospiraceae bacterium]